MSLSPIDLAELLRELSDAEHARASADRAAQAATAEATRAQAVLDTVQDGARLLGQRGRELKHSANAVRDALERARLSALNAALEGAKLGEPLGKAVLTMADDVRAQLSRCADSLEEHLGTLAELDRDRERWLDELRQTRELCAGAAQRLRELGGWQSALARSTSRLSERFRTELGSDAERLQLLAEAGQRTAALRETLERLRGHDSAPDIEALLAPLEAALAQSE
jgi:hypothetical protein